MKPPGRQPFRKVRRRTSWARTSLADVLTRLIYGARISLTVGVATALFSGTVGVTLGLIAGFYRGRIDDLIMRLVDLQMSLPGLLLALFVLYALGPGFQNLILVMIITRWMVYA